MEKIMYAAPPLRSDDGLTYGQRVAAILDVSPSLLGKTLVVKSGERLVAAVLPVDHKLDLKAVARLAGAKKAHLAEADQVLKATGYKPGGVSPISRGRTPLTTYIDDSFAAADEIVVSAGATGEAVRLTPDELVELTGGTFEAIGSSSTA